jgi:hypothetical protein
MAVTPFLPWATKAVVVTKDLRRDIAPQLRDGLSPAVFFGGFFKFDGLKL